MKTAALSLFILAAGCAAGKPGMREALSEYQPDPLERIDISAVEGSPGLYVALCEYHRDWVGYFTCFQYGEAMEWEARIDRRPHESTFTSVRGFTDPRFAGPLVEVVGAPDKTGKANTYVYELKGRTLVLLSDLPSSEPYDLARLAKPAAAVTTGVVNTGFQK